MKEVSVYLHGSQYPLENNRGSYKVVLIYNNHRKVISREVSEETTANRMMLTGLIDATMLLKEACHLKIYATTSLGFSKPHKSINRDLLEIFFKLCEEVGHTFVFSDK